MKGKVSAAGFCELDVPVDVIPSRQLISLKNAKLSVNDLEYPLMDLLRTILSTGK